jgi:DNA-binding transcriptional MerR regulator
MSEPAGGSRGGIPQGLGKLYFRIGEVAELVGVEPHVLRYWEREFRSVRPTKSAKGQRVYSRRDVESLMRVRELLYKEGFTIAGARKKLQRTGAEPALAENGADSAEAAQATRSTARTAEAGGAGQAREAGQASEAEADAAAKAREQLLAMREDIEAFLAELRLRPDGPRG